MIAGGDVYLKVWFDPLVKNLHLISSCNRHSSGAMLRPSDIIKYAGPFLKLTRALTPKKIVFLFLAMMNGCFDGGGGSSAHIR